MYNFNLSNLVCVIFVYIYIILYFAYVTCKSSWVGCQCFTSQMIEFTVSYLPYGTIIKLLSVNQYTGNIIFEWQAMNHL